jgi:uncharacterized protein YndB with AHSA1/START domain
MVTAEPSGLTLRLQRVLPAPPEHVFRALTEPNDLARWWGPHGFTMPSIELDLRIGGRYRFTMQPPAGERFHLSGEFRDVDPPARLAYTFVWEEPTPDDRETLVSLSFADLDGSTEVTLTQGPFATEERRALHEGGWTDSFERLEKMIS